MLGHVFLVSFGCPRFVWLPVFRFFAFLVAPVVFVSVHVSVEFASDFGPSTVQGAPPIFPRF